MSANQQPPPIARPLLYTLNPKLKVCPVTRTAGQTAAVSLHTQQGGTVARRPTSEGARAIKPARAHRTGALQADELAIECITPNLRLKRRVVQFVLAEAQGGHGLLGLPCLSFWPFGLSFPFISFIWAFWGIPFHFGLLGLHFLSFWPFRPSFPFILAFWPFISFHFGLLDFQFLSFWPFGPFISFHFGLLSLHFLSFWPFGPSSY